MKKILTALLSVLLCLLTACSFFGAEKKSFAYPVTEFENRCVKICADGFETEGRLSSTKEQMITLTLVSPESVKDMKITHNASEDKTEFLGLTYSANFLENTGISEVFEAIKVMSDTENLTPDEAGYYGFTPTGKNFTVITDESGAVCKITLEGITVEFTQ